MKIMSHSKEWYSHAHTMHVEDKPILLHTGSFTIPALNALLPLNKTIDLNCSGARISEILVVTDAPKFQMAFRKNQVVIPDFNWAFTKLAETQIPWIPIELYFDPGNLFDITATNMDAVNPHDFSFIVKGWVF